MDPVLNLPTVNLQPEPRSWLPTAARWGVAHTHARAEKVLHGWLSDREVPCFLPLARTRRVYGRHVRSSEVPLFAGYVFFDLAACSRQQVFQSKKVAQVLEPPDPVALCGELERLAQALHSGEPLRLSQFKAGAPVQVVRGPLKGLDGEFVRTETASFLILRVTFLGHAAELKIDEAYVEPVR